MLNTLVTCSDGGVPLQEECGEQRCAADAPVPFCVPADALPCVPDPREARCRNGHIIECAQNAGYLLERSCDPGMLCIGETPEAQCTRAESVRCQADRWTPLCVDEQLFRCDDRRLVIEESCD